MAASPIATATPLVQAAVVSQRRLSADWLIPGTSRRARKANGRWQEPPQPQEDFGLETAVPLAIAIPQDTEATPPDAPPVAIASPTLVAGLPLKTRQHEMSGAYTFRLTAPASKRQEAEALAALAEASTILDYFAREQSIVAVGRKLSDDGEDICASGLMMATPAALPLATCHDYAEAGPEVSAPTGQPLTLTVAEVPVAELTFQWRKNSSRAQGAGTRRKSSCWPAIRPSRAGLTATGPRAAEERERRAFMLSYANGLLERAYSAHGLRARAYSDESCC